MSPSGSPRPAAKKAAKKVTAKKATAKAAESPRSRTRSAERSREVGPPKFDQSAVGRVVPHVNIVNVELVHAHFDRRDDGPIPRTAAGELEPEILVDVEWERDGDTLGCLIRFGAECDDGQPLPFRLFAFFRLTYSIDDPDSIADADLNQFAHWNALFNAWPYWREYLTSTLNRSGLPRLILPVMRMPRHGDS